MFLFIDTETTGLPKSWNAPATAVDSWPRIVTASWIVASGSREIVYRRNFIVRPDGYEIPEEASRIHGVTQQQAMTEGLRIQTVLSVLDEDLASCGHLVAHNLSFDQSVIEAEYHRLTRQLGFEKLKRYCTMVVGTPICKLPGRYDYKWPKLLELHAHLFGEEFDNQHSSLADVSACMRCFWKLVDDKHIVLEAESGR